MRRNTKPSKTSRYKEHITYKKKKTKIRPTSDFSAETYMLEEGDASSDHSAESRRLPKYFAHRFSGPKLFADVQDFTEVTTHIAHRWKTLRAANSKCTRTETLAWGKRYRRGDKAEYRSLAYICSVPRLLGPKGQKCGLSGEGAAK